MTWNWLATAAILTWPLVALALYSTKSTAEATLWTILGAFLLLPSGFSVKLEMIPAFDKNSVPGLCALAGCILVGRSGKRTASAIGVTECLAFILICSPVVTSALNNDTIFIGERILPGVGYYDGISGLLSQLMVFLPFFVGRRVFREAADFQLIVRCLVLAGLFYSIPMLIEIRLSPQLSNWVYGSSPTAFVTEVRYGGYRPVVFMTNGLQAAFFMMTTFLAAVSIWRLRSRIGPLPTQAMLGYMGALVLLTKSAGALIFSIVGAVIVAFVNSKIQLRVALLLATIGILYPVLRLSDAFPNNLMVETAALVNQERADSLGVRFDQEQQLLERASSRFLFGWGRYGRSRVYDDSGKDVSFTDGQWILTLGQFGLIGFLAEFGLLTLPIFRAASAHRLVVGTRNRIFLSVVALIVAFSLVEQIPNASISSWTWLLAGALLGRAERIVQTARKTEASRGFRVSTEKVHKSA